MLEDYYVKPSTVDRVRANWLAPQIESYLEWLESHRYSRLVLYRGLAQPFQYRACHWLPRPARFSQGGHGAAGGANRDFGECHPDVHESRRRQRRRGFSVPLLLVRSPRPVRARRRSSRGECPTGPNPNSPSTRVLSSQRFSNPPRLP